MQNEVKLFAYVPGHINIKCKLILSHTETIVK